MDDLLKDFRKYRKSSLALLVVLSTVALVLLAGSMSEVVVAGNRPLLIWFLLIAVVALTSARHPIRFPGTRTRISVSEAVTFLAIVVCGPYHGVLIAAIDTFLASRRLGIRPSLHLFNISNHTISIYVAGQAYVISRAYLAANYVATSPLDEFVLAGVPLLAMAGSHYILNVAAVAVMSHAAFGRRIWVTVRDTLPWGPVTFCITAAVAGLVNYAVNQYSYVTMVMTLALVLPVPVIIYYTFKTYNDKLDEQKRHHGELTDIYDSILEMLAMAIDAKDEVTHDHIQRVKLFARRMGELVGLNELEIEAVKAGALLHDIGKIGVPAYILNKPGKLTAHEFEQMKMHTIIGADMLSNIDFRYPVVPVVRHHHERWDGKGYPDGLAGEQIPITARILSLVDNYDALCSDRPYKKGLSRPEVLEYLKQNAGTFFDPKLVDIFVSVVDDLESEAENLRADQRNRREARPHGMSGASPAAGFASTPSMDRAVAALNSIAETNQRVTALYEMSRTLASKLSVEDTVAILGSRLAKLIPFTTCAISLLNRSRSELEIVHAVGLHADRFLGRKRPINAGITGWVVMNHRAMYNTNPVLDLGFLGQVLASEYRGVMVFPLVKDREPFGAVALYSTDVENYGSEHIQVMESICQPASNAVHNALAFEQARRSALIDPITGLTTMTAFGEQFEREQARSRRLGTPMSLLSVSIQSLDADRQVTDADVRRQMAILTNALHEQLRGSDLLAQRTDNELISLIPDCCYDEALAIKRQVKDMAASENYNLQIHVGVATGPNDGEGLEQLLLVARTDQSGEEEVYAASEDERLRPSGDSGRTFLPDPT